MTKTSKPTTKQVTAVYKEDGKIVSEDNENAVVEVKVFEVDHVASVSAKYGVTLNMGNCDSVRFDAMVTLPCYMEEVDAAMKCAAEKAEGYVRAQANSDLEKRAAQKESK